MADRTYTHNDYTVGWICPLEVEHVAARAMLEERHARLRQPLTDSNSYTLGSIQGHNVVMAGLPTMGNISTATVVAHMKSTFPRLRFTLLVGIGGGVPTRTDAGPIKLGHIVVSEPTGQHSGAIQYDHGKAETGEFRRTGSLAPPPNVLLNAAHTLAVNRTESREDPLYKHVQRLDTSIRGLRRYKHPGPDKDHLYPPNYQHPNKSLSCQACGCDASKRLIREADEDDDEDDEGWLTVHRGTIASGELVMRNGELRDKLSEQYNVLCFEMEAAGALNDFPCLVIRGIADYSDSHKNDKWHGYASATAAAYARELFFHMPIDEVAQCSVAEADVKQMIEDNRFVKRSTLEGKIRTWLDPPDPSSNHNQARKLHHSGTGSWFLSSEAYARWKTTATHTLWLHGIPGCGKTILSSTVVDDLQSNAPEHPHVLYFYFDFNDSNKRTFDKMLRSILFQLLHRSATSQKHINQLMASCDDGQRQPQTTELETTVRSVIEAIGDVWIIFDALDECNTKTELLAWLKSDTVRQYHLLFTSREVYDIKFSLTDWMEIEDIISIQAAPVNEDIQAFVRHTIEADKDFHRWRKVPGARNMIESKLMERTDGMFRLVVCQMDSLRHCLDWLMLEKTLQSLPDTLDKIYDQILLNITPQLREVATRLLQFLCYSERPLRLEEAVDAIAVRPECTPTFSAQHRMPEPTELAIYCASLTRIVVRPRDDALAASDVVTELQLAHFSVREYLCSGRVEETFRVDLQEFRAKACIVHISLAYLYQASQAHQENGPRELLPFLDYAARYWVDHAPLVATSELVVQWISKLFTSLEFREYWLGLCNPDDPDELSGHLDRPPRPSALYYSALIGLTHVARDLIDGGADIRAEEGGQGNALQAAAFKGHIEIVKLLLDMGADVNARGGEYHEHGTGYEWTYGGENGSALEAASLEGHVKVVTLLIDNGADVNSHIGHYGNALQAASRQGHIDVVALLLDKGADVNAQCGYHGNAIQAASFGGHVKLVKLLIDWGGHVNTYGVACRLLTNEVDTWHDGGRYGNALQAASVRGQVEVMKLLLVEGADINAEGGFHCNAILAALDGDHTECAKLLIDSGANVNAKGGNEGNALQTALRRGHGDIARLLIDKGANIHGEEGQSDNPLSYAANAGHADIVKLLIEKGANVNAKGFLGGTVLHSASAPGNTDIVELLLDSGADVNGSGGYGGSALISASAVGRTETVKLLLDRGADVNAAGGHSGNALYAAADYGSVEVVKLILDGGANVNAKGGLYESALNVAAAQGNFEITKLLLDEGADPKADSSSNNALYAASLIGRKDIVRLLLDAGMDPNAGEGYYGNALNAAARQGYIEVVELLVERGARAEGEGDHHSNAIYIALQHEQIIVADFLLNNRASYEGLDGLGRTLLHVFAADDLCQGISSALKNELDANTIDNQGWTALHWAAYFNRADAVKVLLDHGADQYLRDWDGRTPYHVALLDGSGEATETATLLALQHKDMDSSPTYGHRLVGYCSYCRHDLVEYQHHCTECSAWLRYDLCFRCIRDVDTIHPGHAFTEDFRYPQSLPVTTMSNSSTSSEESEDT